MGVVVRAGSTTCYSAIFGNQGGVFGVELRKTSGTTETRITFETSTEPQLGDILRLEVIGSNLTVYLNGSVLLTASDSTYASGSSGVVAYGTLNSGTLIDNWEGGNLGSAGPTLTIQWQGVDVH
jgi:hypothetical protein